LTDRSPQQAGLRETEAPALTVDASPGFRFFGIVGTWMEEDIIAASVANAFHQGCEQVFVVDNASPDQTVQAAVSAGATIAHCFRTESYDEPARIALMNEVMHAVTEQADAEHAWWLWFDADEFAHGPTGQPLMRYLASLDGRYRVVGARYFHHFPTHAPYCLPTYHPIEFQPLCYEQHSNQVQCSHRKHPLVRLDRGRPVVTMGEGFHRYDCAEPLLEPSASAAFIHHFPFRAPDATHRRMLALCGARADHTSRIQRQDHHELTRYGAPSHASQRFALCDAVYAGQWDVVTRAMPGRHSYEIVLRSWTDMRDGSDLDVWYSTSELRQATLAWHAREQPSGPVATR
jgi:hypothetical protein